MSDVLGYEGKRVIVTGCFSGMGHATAKLLLDLGAQVHGVDYKECDLPLASFTNIDLRNKDSIEDGIASIGGRIDSLFSCAGLPGSGTFPAIDTFTVNFIGHRHLNECVVERMESGGSIVSIASTAGMGWHGNLEKWLGLMQITGWDETCKWAETNVDLIGEGYSSSKEALIVYTQHRAAQLIKQGVRFNVSLPQPTHSPMMKDFEAAASADIVGMFAEPLGRYSTPEEQAGPLVLLNSDLAGIVNGVTLWDVACERQ
ncbi:MAG: coniferyl-alcohol dehydrogenase, partial [Sphingomonadaceae bacterium]|nr:coniferyl-alcohol dehydrogenase [Sphingomonadaceae bacterium]